MNHSYSGMMMSGTQSQYQQQHRGEDRQHQGSEQLLSGKWDPLYRYVGGDPQVRQPQHLRPAVMSRQSLSTNALHSSGVMPANEQPTNRDADPAKFTLLNNNYVGGGGSSTISNVSPSKPQLNTSALGNPG